MSGVPEYIVIRGGGTRWEGRWLRRPEPKISERRMGRIQGAAISENLARDGLLDQVEFEATPETETRQDGAVAQVYRAVIPPTEEDQPDV